MTEREHMRIDGNFVLKGNIGFSREDKTLCCMPESYVVCAEGICMGAFTGLPEKYRDFPLIDCGDDLVIPGMTDLHLHGPQYTFRGLGMDLELLEWLQTHTFPEEAKYQNAEYAKSAYRMFVEDLKRSFTTRACIFATLHKEATMELMDQLEESGLVTLVGKVNMDRNGGEELCEESAAASLEETGQWLALVSEKNYRRTGAILTPRFIPCCSDELMRGLSELQKKHGLRVQSHLSENPSEVAWVRELVPAADSYAGAYDLFRMLGDKEHPAVMAHCVYCSEEEMDLMKCRGVYVAHCPESNLNLSSGIAPVRKYLRLGIDVGIGTDVAGGASLSMAKAMSLAVQCSKMYYRLVNEEEKPLTFAEVFYLATLGGGSYFGKTGSFLEGYGFDAVVVSDAALKSMRSLTVEERLERMIYEETDCRIVQKFVDGKNVYNSRERTEKSGE